MENKYCQSCGMPLQTEELGANSDGSRVVYTKEDAITNMKIYFPTLKRWKVQ